MENINRLFQLSNSDDKTLILTLAKEELERRRVSEIQSLEANLKKLSFVELGDFVKTHSRKERPEKTSEKQKEKSNDDLIRLIPDKDSKKFPRKEVLDFVIENGIFGRITSLLIDEFAITATVKDNDIIFSHGDVEVKREFSHLVDGAYPFKMFIALISNTFAQKGIKLKPYKESNLAQSLQKLREEIYEKLNA